MDQETYDAHAAAIQGGRMIVHDGRSAMSIAQLNWIARVENKDGAPLDLLDEQAAPVAKVSAQADDNITQALGPDSILITKAQYQLALDEHTRPLQDANDALTTENGTLKAQIAALTADATAQSEANATLTRNVEELQETKSEQAATISELATEIGTLQSEKAALTAQITALQSATSAPSTTADSGGSVLPATDAK